jgi:MYXO-CTERM domain-containing protein
VTHQLELIIVLSLSGMLLSASALADVPPPDACDAADEGMACDNAMQNGATVSGTCQKDQCTRATPNGPMTYECYLCKAGAASPTESDDSSDDGGCSMSSSSADSTLAGLPLLGLGWLWKRRRRAGRKVPCS